MTGALIILGLLALFMGILFATTEKAEDKPTVCIDIETRGLPDKEATTIITSPSLVPIELRNPKFAYTKEEIQEAIEKAKELNQIAQQKFDRYVPDQPTYKIVEDDYSVFTIHKRVVNKASTIYANIEDPFDHSMLYYRRPSEPSYYSAKELEKCKTDVRQYYTPITEDYNTYKSQYLYGQSYIVPDVEKRPITFLIYADAAAFLQRLLQRPEEKEVWFDENGTLIEKTS